MAPVGQVQMHMPQRTQEVSFSAMSNGVVTRAAAARPVSVRALGHLHLFADAHAAPAGDAQLRVVDDGLVAGGEVGHDGLRLVRTEGELVGPVAVGVVLQGAVAVLVAGRDR